MAAQAKFKAKYELPFTLLSDPDGKVCEAYFVMKDKSMYGKIFKGIERTTFLIGADGTIIEANQRAVEMYGYDHAELLGTSVELLPTERCIPEFRLPWRTLPWMVGDTVVLWL